MGNYSGEACLSGAVKTVIARGTAGYREANRTAARDFDYQESAKPSRILHVTNNSVYIRRDAASWMTLTLPEPPHLAGGSQKKEKPTEFKPKKRGFNFSEIPICLRVRANGE